MDYKTSLNFLNGLSFKGIKLGLKNIKKVLAYFGDPHFKIPTIHIAGTNGKGSIAAFVESILRTSDFRVGLFTSPHFIDFTERIQINRKPISKYDFASIASELKQVIKKLDLSITYFEFSTLLAFLYFSEEKPDWIILEVGMGGRLDCTNVCMADISIISSISLDHQTYLGNTIESIAFEKASIIKSFGTVIADKQKGTVENIIREFANEKKANVRFLGRDFFVNRKNYSWMEQTFDFKSHFGKLNDIRTKLLGIHQVFNAGVAVEAILCLREKGHRISNESVIEGVKNCEWEGRLEVVQKKPYLVLDSAHNIDSVKYLTIAIKEYFQYQKCIIILGIMKDKDIEKIGFIISEIADKIILTKPNIERGADPNKLKKVLSKTQKPIEIIDEIQYSVKIAKKLASPEDLICVTGSLYTIAEVKLFLNNEKNSNNIVF